MAYEAARPRKHWGLYGIVGHAVIAIALGVISIVAANWEEIEDATKLIAYFTLMALCGAGFIWGAESSIRSA